MGDHGMTSTGDHGGDSDNELNAALFMYSKRWKSHSRPETEGNRVNQVDFVPTFSLLMGLPIPFSNIGKVINEVFISGGLKQLQYLKVNVEQVFNYLNKYQTSQGPMPEFQDMDQKKKDFLEKKIRQPGELSMDMNLGLELLEAVKDVCQSKFVNFDLPRIYMGCYISCLHVCLMIVLSLDKIFLKQVITNKLFFSLASLLALGIFSNMVLKDDLNHLDFPWVTLFCTILCFLSILWRIRHSITEVYSSLKINTDFFNLFHIMIYFTLCLGLFSNSFIVEEAHAHSYVILSIFIIHCLKTRLIFKSKICLALCLISLGVIRLTTAFFRCREEQQGYCIPSDFHKPIHTLDNSLSKDYRNRRFAISCSSVLLTSYVIRKWLMKGQNLEGLSPASVLVKHLPKFVTMAFVCQWVLQYASDEKALKYIPQFWQHQAISLAIYATCLISIGIIVIQPCFVHLQTKKNQEQPKVYRGVKTYYNLMKANWREFFNENRKGSLYGLHSAISAPFISIALFLCYLTMLLVGDGLCPSVFLCVLSMAFFLYLDSENRLRGAKTLQDLLHVPWTSVITWSLLENLFFYATGHQPTFNTIQWSAAFVGFSGANYGAYEGYLGLNYWLPALLVGWNTFASRILFAFLLPVLLVTPFGLVKILKNDDPILEDDDLEDGE